MNGQRELAGARPGWYPDPIGPRQMRWWDGRAWTGHAVPKPRFKVPVPLAMLCVGFAALSYLVAATACMSTVSGIAQVPQPNQTAWIGFTQTLMVIPVGYALVGAVVATIVRRHWSEILLWSSGLAFFPSVVVFFLVVPKPA